MAGSAEKSVLEKPATWSVTATRVAPVQFDSALLANSALVSRAEPLPSSNSSRVALLPGARAELTPRQVAPARTGTTVASVAGSALRVVAGIGRYAEGEVARAAAPLALRAAAPLELGRGQAAAILLSEGQYDVYLVASASERDLSFRALRFNYSQDQHYSSVQVVVDQAAGVSGRPPWEFQSLITADGVELYVAADAPPTTSLRAEPDLGFSAGRTLASYARLLGPGLSAASSQQELLTAFELSMRAIALRAIAEAEPQMRVLRGRMQGDLRYAQAELGVVRELVPKIQAARAATRSANWDHWIGIAAQTSDDADPSDLMERRAALEGAEKAESALYDQYPLLGRLKDFDAFAAGDDRERANALAAVLGNLLGRLPDAREWLTRGTTPGLASPLWTNSSLVELTIAELGIEDQRFLDWIHGKASSQSTTKVVEDAALAVVSVVLLIASFFTSGGTSLAVAVAGAGTNLASQSLSSREYLERYYLNATNIDPKRALAEADATDERLLLLGWAMLPLDAAQIRTALAEYRAARLVGKAERSAEAMRAFVAKRLQTPSLTEKTLLELAEGAVRRPVLAADLPGISKVLQAPVELVPALKDGIQVVPKYDRFGFVQGVTVLVGDQASLGVLVRHAGTVDSYRRLGSLSGRAEELLRRLRSRLVGPSALASAADPRSATFEAIEEVRKLRKIVADVRDDVAHALLSGDNLEATALRLDRYEGQLAEQNSRLEAYLSHPELSPPAGRGYVAAEATGAPPVTQLADALTPDEIEIDALAAVAQQRLARANEAGSKFMALSRRDSTFREARALHDAELSAYIKAKNQLEAAQRKAGITPDQLYERLRPRTPNRAMELAAQARGNIDPIYGHVIDGVISPDHIVPVVDIVRMPGFAKLPPHMQAEVVNLAENTMGMDVAANLSKGDRLWSAKPGSSRYWEGHPQLNAKFGPITPAVREKMIREEEKARAALVKAIQSRLEKLGIE